MRLILVMLMGFACTACSTTWTRPDFNHQTLARDSSECELKGQAAYPQNPLLSRNLYGQCMVGRG